MLLNRNTCESKSKSSLGICFVLIMVIIITAFGAREHIKNKIREFLAIEGVNKAEVEKMIENYIAANPKAIIDSLQEMQKREHEEMLKQAQKNIHDKKDVLQGKGSEIVPFSGNKDGDVVIVTFLDYRCGYCKTTNRELKELIKKDANVKVLFKEFPILGPQSKNLAQMALAVYLIDNSKYMDFHNALMDSNEFDDKSIDAIFTKLNLDRAKVMEHMKDARIQKELDNVVNLAGEIGVLGTPAFIINDELMIGRAHV